MARGGEGEGEWKGEVFFPYGWCRAGPGLSCSVPPGGSPVSPLTVSTPLRCPHKVQGPFSRVLQLERGWVDSPVCVRGLGDKKRGHLSLTHNTTWQTRRAEPTLPFSLLQGQLAQVLSDWVSSIGLPRWGERTCSLECYTGWGAEPALSSVAAREGQRRLCVGLSSRPLVVSGDMDSNTDHSCSRAIGPDMNPGSSPDPDITMTPSSKQDTTLSPLLTTFTSLDLPVSTEHEPFCLSPIPHRTFAHYNSAWLPRTAKEVHAFSLVPGHGLGMHVGLPIPLRHNDSIFKGHVLQSAKVWSSHLTFTIIIIIILILIMIITIMF